MFRKASHFDENLLQLLVRERRASARYYPHTEGTGPAVQDEQGNEREAQITNISAGGIGLVMAYKPQPGEILRIQLLCKDGTPYNLLGRVLRVETHGEGAWQVGC